MVEHLCDDLNTPAAFAAIDRIVDSSLPTDRDRYTVQYILRLLGVHVSRSNIARAADDVATALRAVSLLSVSDWTNLAVAIKGKPLGSNGKPRPGTKLLAALGALDKSLGDLRPAIRSATENPIVADTLENYLRSLQPDQDPFEKRVIALLAKRNAARKAKNFAESDRIRDELAAMGVVLQDSKDGTTWEVAR